MKYKYFYRGMAKRALFQQPWEDPAEAAKIMREYDTKATQEQKQQMGATILGGAANLLYGGVTAIPNTAAFAANVATAPARWAGAPVGRVPYIPSIHLPGGSPHLDDVAHAAGEVVWPTTGVYKAALSALTKGHAGRNLVPQQAGITPDEFFGGSSRRFRRLSKEAPQVPANNTEETTKWLTELSNKGFGRVVKRQNTREIYAPITVRPHYYRWDPRGPHMTGQSSIFLRGATADVHLPRNGVSKGVAAHEIGHALSFIDPRRNAEFIQARDPIKNWKSLFSPVHAWQQGTRIVKDELKASADGIRALKEIGTPPDEIAKIHQELKAAADTYKRLRLIRAVAPVANPAIGATSATINQKLQQ